MKKKYFENKIIFSSRLDVEFEVKENPCLHISEEGATFQHLTSGVVQVLFCVRGYVKK